MTRPSYFRLKGKDSDLPLMLWPHPDGEFIVQVGRERPWTTYTDRPRFATMVIDNLWMVEPITKSDWHLAMDTGVWPDGRSSKETT